MMILPPIDEELSLEAAVQAAVSASATCWEHPELAGRFDDNRAASIVRWLTGTIEAIYEPPAEVTVRHPAAYDRQS